MQRAAIVVLVAFAAFAPSAAAAPVNLAGPGLVPVTVADPRASIAGVAPERTGVLDGQVIAHYDKQALVRAGALHAATRQLVASDGSVEPVEPEVVLQVKLASGVRRIAGALEPLVREADVAALQRKARGRALPDLGAWHRLTLPAGSNADATIATLLASGQVTHASVAPDPAPPPQVASADYTPLQRYLRPAPQGIDADFSRADPRLRGKGVRIVDLEYYWTADHEDLQLDPVATDLGGAAFPQYRAFADEHGTAVFGVMVAKDNGSGVTGGVPDATMHGISPTQGPGATYAPAAALTYVARFLSPGDILLIENQTPGPGGGVKYVPLEWDQPVFDAITALTALGVVVMETGGNGGEDLDSAPMAGKFDRSVRDSGAIIGGAGSSTTREALWYSSHGARIDLQGWGENIATTGGNGDLFGSAAELVKRRYTRSFSGTSGAGPIVVNALVAVQSYLKATGQAPYTSAQLRDLLRRTGTPQTGAKLIGPLPNVKAALLGIEVDAPELTLTLDGATATLTAQDGWGTGVKTLEYRVDGGAWTPYAAPFEVAEGSTVDARATDFNGNSSLESATRPAPRAQVLTLTLGPAPSFGTFTPGVDRVYTATTSVAYTPGAVLTVSGPGRLSNGSSQLAQPAQVAFAAASVTLTQAIGASEVLRTGTYSAPLTFTVTTATP